MVFRADGFLRLRSNAGYAPRTMPKFLLPLVVLFALISLTGCSLWGKKDKKPASSSHLYEGNAPTIHFNDAPETAGGPLNPS